jgi:hypothetical protein
VPHVVWSRSVEGELPDLLLGEGRILLHYTVARGKKTGTELRCYDLEGVLRWSWPGWRCLLPLPGGRFLVNPPDGRPLVVNGEGDVLHRWRPGEVAGAERHGDMLLLGGMGRVWASDLELCPLWGADWPEPRPSGPVTDCFVGGAFYWVVGDGLWRWAPGGPPEPFCRLPQDLITGAMDEYERAAGNAALAGFSFWRVAFDEAAGRFFLTHTLPGPHLVLCLDASGRPRWCRYVSPGCCGGFPSRVPNGLYVASSGCGGVLSWLDRHGRIVFQSEPHEGVGLETAYSNEVLVLPDGRSLVGGGPGVVAYGPTGERLWVFGHGYLRLRCDPAGQFLAGCYWRDEQPAGPSRAWLEMISGL